MCAHPSINPGQRPSWKVKERKSDDTCVGDRRRWLHRWPSRCPPARAGGRAGPRRGPRPPRRVAPALRRRRQPVVRPPGPGRVRACLRGRRHRLQPRRRHGRDGVHREQQGPVHALGADLDAHARGGPQGRRAAILLLVLRLRLRGRQAGVTRSRAPARGGRLSGHARGRLRLGEALQRADGPPLLRGLRARDPRRPLPQRLRARRDLRRGQGEGARRHLPEGRRRRARRQRRDRDLGRRSPDAQFHLHRRLRGGHAAAHGQRRAGAAQHRLRAVGHDQRARRHRRGHRRGHPQAQLRPRRRPRASGAATATTRSSGGASAGRRPSPWRTGCATPTSGSSTR